MGLREDLAALADKYAPAASVVASEAPTPAIDGAGALANVRAYKSPVSGTPQWTDDAGRAHSDRAWTVAMNDDRPFADKALLEILARADLLTDFKWVRLANVTADEWVANEIALGQHGSPSIG